MDETKSSSTNLLVFISKGFTQKSSDKFNSNIFLNRNEAKTTTNKWFGSFLPRVHSESYVNFAMVVFIFSFQLWCTLIGF